MYFSGEIIAEYDAKSALPKFVWPLFVEEGSEFHDRESKNRYQISIGGLLTEKCKQFLIRVFQPFLAYQESKSC